MTREPVKTTFGWHVIRVDDRRTAEVPPFEEARRDLASEMTQEAVSDLIDELRADATIERFAADGTPAEE